MDDLTTPHGRHAFALETHRMALDLYDSIFPPWRWPRWWKESREVKRRIRRLKAAMPDA